MKPRTREYLDRATQNNEVAGFLANQSPDWLVAAPPLQGWALVVFFYAGVHYVNAYLWEAQNYEPRDHDSRQRALARDVRLRSGFASYARLRELAFQSRYNPAFQPSARTVEEAARDIETVRTTIETAIAPIQ